MPDYTPDQFERLPKWAQNHITKQEADLKHALAVLGEGPAESNAIADPYSKTPRPLGKTTIRFFPTTRDKDYIDVRVDPHGYLEIHADGDLVVSPRAANGIQVRAVHHAIIGKIDSDGLTRARREADDHA